MKKVFLYILISILSLNMYSQNLRNINIDDYKLDSRITSKLVDKTKKNRKINIYQQNNEIYFLGWSKDSKIAFIENRAIDGRGGHDFLFVIQDLANEKVCFSKKISGYDLDDSLDSKNITCTFKKCLSDNSKELNNKLNEYEIVLKPCEVIFSPLFDSNKKEIKFDINKTKKDEAQFVLQTGYIKSPYEERFALIVAKVLFVYEGHEVFVDFYGYSSDESFEK